jgi:hypothetical protein
MLVSQALYFSFRISRVNHFEENRRQMYGYERNAYSYLLERLRVTRENAWELMVDFQQYWPEDDAPVREDLGAVCGILTTLIAIEIEPRDEEWSVIRSVMDESERQMQEEAQNRERLNLRAIRDQMAQETDGPFTLSPFESESEMEDAPRPGRDFFAPVSPRSESEDDFPLW